jgi:hypothetical protein
MTDPTSDRLAQLARETETLMGPFSPGRPIFYAISRAVSALRGAAEEAREFERNHLGADRP